MSFRGVELRKPNDVRSIEGLAEVRANGRILNLGAISRDLGDELNLNGDEINGFFGNRPLNSAIIVKHNVRENERYLLTRYRPVATKIILPIDPDDLSLGGASFMLSERMAGRILKDKFGLHGKSEAPSAARDLKILEILDSLATLDPFIIRERLAVDGFALPEAFTAFQLKSDARLLPYMKAQLMPLVRLALGDSRGHDSDDRAMDRLADEVFSGTPNSRADLLRMALRIDEEKWPAALYTWKAALFYEYRVRNFESRFRRFMESVQKTKIYAFSMQSPPEIVLPLRLQLIDRALRTKSKLDRLLSSFNQAYRKDLIGAGTPEAFRDYLTSLQDKLYDFGVVNGVLEQMVGYWEYWFLSRGVANVPADFFQSVARDLLTSAEPAGGDVEPAGRRPANFAQITRMAPLKRPGAQNDMEAVLI